MDAYQIICELVSGNPNVDMLIVRPYLYVYVRRDKIDNVTKNGLSRGKSDSIQALFTRLPENKYQAYLRDHVPLKISVAKLTKIKDQKIIVRPVNFDYEKDSLTEDDVQKILDKSSDKLRSMMSDGVDISKLPRADIIFSGDVLPSFVIKVLDVEPLEG